MPTTLPDEITLIFSYPDARTQATEASITHKTGQNFRLVFRHVEALFGKKQGCLAFSYKRRWLEDSESPLELGDEMRDNDIIDCVAIIRITIVHSNSGPQGLQVASVDPADVSATFSMLFADHAAAINTDPGLLHFFFNGKRLSPEDRIVDMMWPNDDGFVILAMPVSATGSSSNVGPTLGVTSLAPEFRVAPPSSPIIDAPPLEPPLADAVTPKAMLLQLKTALHTADANWLGALIHSWPESCPLQEDDDIIWNFARQFMTWRDALVHQATHEPPTRCITRQMWTLALLEQLHQDWHTEALLSWKTHQAKPVKLDYGLQQAINTNATRRMRREAKILSILGSLIGAWKTHLADGLALLSTGPGVHSDLRILRECRIFPGEAQTVEGILEACKINGGVEFLRENTLVTSDSVSLTSTVEDERPVERPLKRRESARLRRTVKHDPQPADLPPLEVLRQQSGSRLPILPGHSEIPSPRVPKTRREIIQHEWNKIASDAGAAGIEFVNEIDDEEVPPGIGVLFPYIERSYLFDIGIPKPTTMVPRGCRCRGKIGCGNAGRCSCQATLEGGPAYNAKGRFTFQTDSEIIECNNSCECSHNCANRVAQFPRRIPVQVFKTEKRGWGARIPVDLKRGRVVGLYTGLLIRRDEADKLSGSRASYCFDLDVNEEPDEEPSENAYSVDAYGCGNWTRFIKCDFLNPLRSRGWEAETNSFTGMSLQPTPNWKDMSVKDTVSPLSCRNAVNPPPTLTQSSSSHCCNPNLQIISVVYETMPEDNMPYLALVATKNIPAYTELTFDYNPAHQTEWELKRYREKSRSKMSKGKKQTRCLCGARECRGWLSVVGCMT